MSSIAKGFDPRRVSNVVNAELYSTCFIPSATSRSTITYDYDAGYGITMTCWLTYTSFVPDESVMADIPIDAEHFPDGEFREFIMSEYGMDDSVLSWSERLYTTELELCFSENTVNLTGIEYFSELQELEIIGDEVISINLNKLSYLSRLDVLTLHCGALDTVDAGYFTGVKKLYIDSCELISLDISKNVELEELNCSGNFLSGLDVSNNKALKVLMCQGNSLTEIDLSKNTELEELSFGNNPMTEIDLTKNINLKNLTCTNMTLTSLDLSNNPKLELLNLYGSKNIQPNYGDNSPLKRLHISNCGLSSIDLSKLSALEYIDCSYNSLVTLDVSKKPALKTVDGYYNQLGALDFSNNPDLKSLSLEGNQITSINLKQNPQLEQLGVEDNKLTSLDLSNNTKLTFLSCSYNKLTSLDLSANPKLTTVVADNNELVAIVLSCAPSYTFSADDNCIELGNVDACIDMNELCEFFDMSKVSELTGASIIFGKFVPDEGSQSLSYKYDCGYGYKITCNISYTLLPHTHEFSEQNVCDETLYLPFTCEEAAVYFYSCKCGLISTDTNMTFEYGEGHHVWSDKWTVDFGHHWHDCINCSALDPEECDDYGAHVYTISESVRGPISCSYMRCKCGCYLGVIIE